MMVQPKYNVGDILVAEGYEDVALIEGINITDVDFPTYSYRNLLKNRVYETPIYELDDDDRVRLGA